MEVLANRDQLFNILKNSQCVLIGMSKKMVNILTLTLVVNKDILYVICRRGTLHGVGMLLKM